MSRLLIRAFCEESFPTFPPFITDFKIQSLDIGRTGTTSTWPESKRLWVNALTWSSGRDRTRSEPGSSLHPAMIDLSLGEGAASIRLNSAIYILTSSLQEDYFYCIETFE